MKSPVPVDCVSTLMPRLSLISVTVAPGTVAPCASATVPTKAPVVWACVMLAPNANSPTTASAIVWPISYDPSLKQNQRTPGCLRSFGRVDNKCVREGSQPILRTYIPDFPVFWPVDTCSPARIGSRPSNWISSIRSLWTNIPRSSSSVATTFLDSRSITSPRRRIGISARRCRRSSSAAGREPRSSSTPRADRSSHRKHEGGCRRRPRPKAHAHRA